MLVCLQFGDMSAHLFVVPPKFELLFLHLVDELNDPAEDVPLDQRFLEAIVLVKLLHIGERLRLEITMMTKMRFGASWLPLQMYRGLAVMR